MGIDLDIKLVETASKVAITTNQDGDINYGTTTDSPCLYSDISTMEFGANRENVNIDGLLWFGADEDVSRGDVYYHSDEGYLRVVRITKAKRLLIDNSVQFYKCEVEKQRQVS